MAQGNEVGGWACQYCGAEPWHQLTEKRLNPVLNDEADEFGSDAKERSIGCKAGLTFS